jgi:hypothetical protein
MRRQYKVLAQAREETRRHGHEIALPLWSYSAIFGPSKKQEQRGKEGASKTIFPMISGIPDEITPAYLQRHEVPLEFADHFIKITENALEWAADLTQRIASGMESGDTSYGDESGDHPFDDSDSSKGLKPMSDAELRKFTEGTANIAQRRALQNLGNLELAQKPNLSKEEAGTAITAANKRR